MNINTATLPKQARALLEGQNKVSTYETTGGATTEKFAAQNLELFPPIPAGSVVHDNMCGSGTVTRAILTSSPSADIKIHATDIDQIFLDALSSDIQKNSWPVSISNQKAEALQFEDNYFTLSITNIGIFFASSAGLDGAKEIYRTLKPGGTAVVNCWAHITWQPPIFKVHLKTRPNKPFPAPPIGWSDGKQLQKVLKEAGFSESKTEVRNTEVLARVPGSELRTWAGKTWAYLGGIGGWEAEDEEKWDGAVDALVEELRSADGTTVKEEDGVEVVYMKASQWVAVAQK